MCSSPDRQVFYPAFLESADIPDKTEIFKTRFARLNRARHRGADDKKTRLPSSDVESA
jgi:hypothetical protein